MLSALGRFFLYVGAFLIGRSKPQADGVRALDISICNWKRFRFAITQCYEERRYDIWQMKIEEKRRELLFSSLRDQTRFLYYLIDGEIRTIERNMTLQSEHYTTRIQSANAAHPEASNDLREERQHKNIEGRIQ